MTTAWMAFFPRKASAVSLAFVKTRAEISSGMTLRCLTKIGAFRSSEQSLMACETNFATSQTFGVKNSAFRVGMESALGSVANIVEMNAEWGTKIALDREGVPPQNKRIQVQAGLRGSW